MILSPAFLNVNWNFRLQLCTGTPVVFLFQGQIAMAGFPEKRYQPGREGQKSSFPEERGLFSVTVGNSLLLLAA